MNIDIYLPKYFFQNVKRMEWRRESRAHYGKQWRAITQSRWQKRTEGMPFILYMFSFRSMKFLMTRTVPTALDSSVISNQENGCTELFVSCSKPSRKCWIPSAIKNLNRLPHMFHASSCRRTGKCQFAYWAIYVCISLKVTYLADTANGLNFTLASNDGSYYPYLDVLLQNPNHSYTVGRVDELQALSEYNSATRSFLINDRKVVVGESFFSVFSAAQVPLWELNQESFLVPTYFDVRNGAFPYPNNCVIPVFGYSALHVLANVLLRTAQMRSCSSSGSTLTGVHSPQKAAP